MLEQRRARVELEWSQTKADLDPFLGVGALNSHACYCNPCQSALGLAPLQLHLDSCSTLAPLCSCIDSISGHFQQRFYLLVLLLYCVHIFCFHAECSTFWLHFSYSSGSTPARLSTLHYKYPNDNKVFFCAPPSPLPQAIYPQIR